MCGYEQRRKNRFFKITNQEAMKLGCRLSRNPKLREYEFKDMQTREVIIPGIQRLRDAYEIIIRGELAYEVAIHNKKAKIDNSRGSG